MHDRFARLLGVTPIGRVNPKNNGSITLIDEKNADITATLYTGDVVPTRKFNRDELNAMLTMAMWDQCVKICPAIVFNLEIALDDQFLLHTTRDIFSRRFNRQFDDLNEVKDRLRELMRVGFNLLASVTTIDVAARLFANEPVATCSGLIYPAYNLFDTVNNLAEEEAKVGRGLIPAAALIDDIQSNTIVNVVISQALGSSRSRPIHVALQAYTTFVMRDDKHLAHLVAYTFNRINEKTAEQPHSSAYN